jgi:hypothetical protein
MSFHVRTRERRGKNLEKAAISELSSYDEFVIVSADSETPNHK